MNLNREDVVQSALNVQRWCEEHFNVQGICDCPFANREVDEEWSECKLFNEYPKHLHLEEFLRNRGIKDGK